MGMMSALKKLEASAAVIKLEFLVVFGYLRL